MIDLNSSGALIAHIIQRTMPKSLLKVKPELSEWRDLPGLLSYIECNDLAKVHFKNGQEHEELPMITNSFLQLGASLGNSIGLSEFAEVLIEMEDKRAFFAIHQGRHVGLEQSRQ